MSLYRIEMDAFGTINIFRLRHASEPNFKNGFVYGLRDNLVRAPKNDFRAGKAPRPLDTWFAGDEKQQYCYTQNSVLVACVREFQRRFKRAQLYEKRERKIDHSRDMRRLLKTVMSTSRGYI